MKNNKGLRSNVFVSITAILLGIVASFLLIALTGISPLKAFGVLLSGAFGTSGRVSPFLITLGQSTPLILTGLAAMYGFRVGVFCIAQEGQYVFGAVMAAWLGVQLHLPPYIEVPCIFIASIAAGGLYGLIPGLLKVKLGVNEIISSIMLNNIATLALEYLVAFPLRSDAGQKAQSAVLDQALWLPQFVKGSRWGVSFVIAITLVFLSYIYIWKTPGGYEMRMVGKAPLFAKYGGIKSDRVVLRTMFIGGGIAGLAGCMEILGNYHRIMTGFSSGLGFDGLSVAMLGGSHPFGVLLVAILLAGIRQGAQLGLQINLKIPRELGGVLIALIIFFVATENIYRPMVERIYDKVFNFFHRLKKNSIGNEESVK
ncbi:ABC transporter permease [uncultured Sphaerochaeta sp.]|uniref:ABC transporter permease n=1 Tax=uncultured Sphaerochaeta sp. TaxID=886478 RepID=UPI002A0A15A3|nr:ABC transporter permease [uncultured Sphaerochaeta sp.]